MGIRIFVFFLVFSSICHSAVEVEGLSCSGDAWRIFSDDSKVTKGLAHRKGNHTAIHRSPTPALEIKLKPIPSRNPAAPVLLRGASKLLFGNDLAVQINMSGRDGDFYVVFQLIEIKNGKTVRILGEDRESLSAASKSVSANISNLDVDNIYLADGIYWADDDHEDRKHLVKHILSGKLEEGISTGVVVQCEVVHPQAKSTEP